MQEILIHKLHDFVSRNNPDVLINLEQEGRVTTYLKEKLSSVDTILNELISAGTPPSQIEELCMDWLTSDLRPSRYNYIEEILETEFPVVHRQLKEAGVLTTEILNMIKACKEVFEGLRFSETTVESRLLHYATAGAIYEYLENKK